MAPSHARRHPEPDASPGPRERVLEEALRLFAESGFSRVTLRAIGGEVGLHNSSLFHHFRSKAEIARDVFEGVLERLLPRVERLASDDPPELEHLIEVVLDVADHFRERPEDARFLMRVMLDPEVFLSAYVTEIDADDADQPVVQLFSAVWGWLDRAREAGVIRPVHVYQAARSLFGLMLFEPVYGFHELTEERSATEAGRRHEHRRNELEAFVRGAFTPLPDRQR